MQQNCVWPVSPHQSPPLTTLVSALPGFTVLVLFTVLGALLFSPVLSTLVYSHLILFSWLKIGWTWGCVFQPELNVLQAAMQRLTWVYVKRKSQAIDWVLNLSIRSS